jgi:hypothetical protein
MTARLLADSTNPSGMPDWVSVKAFYINGRYKATPAQIAAWRGPKIRINVTGSPADGGDVLDVESEDATPADIPAWYDAGVARGARYLGVYSDRDQFQACTTALAARPAARWLATLNGELMTTFNGIVLDACQLLGSTLTGENYDLSIIFNDAWHPGYDTDIPNPDIADLAHQAALLQGNVTSLLRTIKRL